MRKASITRFFVMYFTFSCISNMVHPITPAFLQSINCPDYMFGVAYASMSFANFLTSAFWGRLGDRYGYAKVMGYSYLGYTFGQLVFSMATNSWIVILARMLSGTFIAGFSVNAMAYIASSTEDMQLRSKYMAIYAAMMSVGAAVGFLAGGLIGDFSMSLVFKVQFIGLTIAALINIVILGEYKLPDEQKKLTFREVNPVSTIMASVKLITPSMGVFLLTVILTSFATQAHDSSFNYYLRAQLAFPPSGNGIFKAVVGTIGLVANFTINMWMIRHTDTRRSIAMVLALCGGALVLMVTVSGVPMFLMMAVVFYTFNAIYLPIQQSLMIRNDNGGSKGAMSGLFNASRSLGSIAGPLFSGFAFSTNPKLPFIAAGIMFFIATALCVKNARMYEKEEI